MGGPRGQRVRRYLRQAQKLFALDGARVILSQAVSCLPPKYKSAPSSPRRTLSSFINRFRSLSTSSLSTVPPKEEHRSDIPFRHRRRRGWGLEESAQLDPWTMLSSTALVVLPILPAPVVLDNFVCLWIPLPARSSIRIAYARRDEVGKPQARGAGGCRARDAGVAAQRRDEAVGLGAPGRQCGVDDGRLVPRLSPLSQVSLNLVCRWERGAARSRREGVCG